MISTLGVIPPSPAEIAERLAIKMGLVRQSLISKGEFLSDPAISGRVHWVPFGHGHKLVIKSEEPLAPDAIDSPLSDLRATDLSPSDVDATDLSLSDVDDTASTRSGGTTNTQLPTPDQTPTPSPLPVVPAILAMVVQVVPGHSWLYPDGRWTGPTGFVKQFSDVKLLCTGAAPDHVRFKNDFETSVASLKSLMADIRTTGYPTTGVLAGPDQNVKVRHNLFVEYENADDADPIDIAATRDWPTSSPKAAEDLAALAETHAVCPLPAYDQNGVLIEPRWYARRLEGATVILRFELNHYLIRDPRNRKEKPTDTFSARLVQLRVIIPPPAASPATPRKRKVLPSDNYFGSFTPRKNPKDGDDDDDKENCGGVRKRLRFGAPSGSLPEGGGRTC